VQIPPILRSMAAGKCALEAEGATLAAVLASLAREYPALALHLFDENGVARRHVLCIHAADMVRPDDFATHLVGNGDEIVLANALAGG
jgi:molybdopterin converting factor small subunit